MYISFLKTVSSAMCIAAGVIRLQGDIYTTCTCIGENEPGISIESIRVYEEAPFCPRTEAPPFDLLMQIALEVKVSPSMHYASDASGKYISDSVAFCIWKFTIDDHI